MKQFLFFVVLFILSSTMAKADAFRYLQPNDGLISGEINDITQDKEGRIWLATWTGLICYDGYNFSNFRPILGDSTSLPDKKIKRLFIDTHNQLWIATEKNLAKMDLTTFRFQTFKFDRNQSFPINILHINQLKEYIIVHAVEGLFQIPADANGLHSKLRKLKLYQENRLVNPYLNITRSHNQTVFIGASNSGSRQNAFLYFTQITETPEDTLLQVIKTEQINGIVNDIADADGDSVFFATSKGIYTYRLSKSQFSEQQLFSNQNIQHVLVTSVHKVFASDNTPGLYCYNMENGVNTRYMADPNHSGSILNSNILTLFEDFSGSLWVGHQGQGVSILDLTRKEFLTIRRNPSQRNTLNSNTIMCFETNSEYLLVGCRRGGVNIAKLNDLEDRETNFKEIPSENSPLYQNYLNGIWDICGQNDSIFWIGHNSGIDYLIKDKSGWTLRPLQLEPALNNHVRSIFLDKFNNLWCGTFSNGLLFIPNPKNNPTLHYYRFNSNPKDPKSLSDNVIISLYLDSNEQLWIGTNNGLNRLEGRLYNYDLSGNKKPKLTFEQFIGVTRTDDYLNNNEINCIIENSDGKIWVATQGGGINILNPKTSKFSHLTTKQGLPGNDVFGMVADDKNNLWISTERGLVKYDQSSADPKITVYRNSDGIQSNVFLINSYYKAKDGRLYFGGENGFTTFYPKKIVPNTIPPRTLLSGLEILNRSIHVGDTIYRNHTLQQTINETRELTLPFSENTFSIGVAAIHFQNPEGNIISYTLEGYQKHWQEISSTEKNIVFTKIPAGNYTFKAYATSSDNIADRQLKTIAITILPPWYLTKLMIVLYLIISLAAITFTIVALVNRQKQLYLKQLYDLTIENNESKMTYLANIAHELRTPLSLIISPIEDMIINKNEVRKRWHNHIQLIHRNSKYILKLINQIIDFRKLDAGKLKLVKHNTDLTALVNDVAYNFKAFENVQNIDLRIDLPAEPIIINIDAQKVEEILYNLLSNAFKHTPNNHSIVIALEQAENDLTSNDTLQPYIYLSVFNEGEEIKEEERDKIFERFYKADEKADGTGIGLSFAKSLIEMHEGKIWFENVPAKGVKFWISLPYVVADTLEEDLVHDYLQDESNYQTDTPKTIGLEKSFSQSELKTKILIVEDNKDLREYLVNILSRTYQCYEASEGGKALKITLSIIPDIIVTDVVMPNVDGYSFVKKVKEDIKTCHIPVIMLTAKQSNDNIIDGFESGVDAYIAKPFDTNVLLSQISRLIKNRELIHKKYKQQNFMVEVTTHNLSRDDIFLNNVKELLEKNISNPTFNVSELSEEMQMSTTQLYRKIKGLTNYSPVEFMRITRLHRAHDLLAEKNYSIKEVCYLTGFNNFSYFVKCFREYFGVTPANYRDKGDA